VTPEQALAKCNDEHKKQADLRELMRLAEKYLRLPGDKLTIIGLHEGPRGYFTDADLERAGQNWTDT
jgi:hypothetical protein